MKVANVLKYFFEKTHQSNHNSHDCLKNEREAKGSIHLNSFQFSNFQILEDRFSNFPNFQKSVFQFGKKSHFDYFFCQKATYLILLMTSELNFKTHKVHFPQKYQAFKFWKIEVCNKIGKLEDRFFEILENWKSILRKKLEYLKNWKLIEWTLSIYS